MCTVRTLDVKISPNEIRDLRRKSAAQGEQIRVLPRMKPLLWIFVKKKVKEYLDYFLEWA